MTKFKIGDKVVCVNAIENSLVKVGEEYTVDDTSGRHLSLVGKGSCLFFEDRFELAEELTQDFNEIIADLQNQLDTWKRIHATDQECIRAFMGKGFDLSQHVVLPVEEFRRMENRLLDESKYAENLVTRIYDLVAENKAIAAERRELVNIILRLRKPGNDVTHEESLKIMKILEEVK